MTNVLDRSPAVDVAPEIELIPPDHGGAPPARPNVSLFGRAALASMLVGAAVIHFVMVPSHLDEWTAEGIAFLVAGWVQLALAAMVFRRATRATMWIAIACNVAFAGAWAWTRVRGSPWGPHSGIKESVGFVDTVCVALEVAFVLGALVFLWRPALGGRARGRKAWIAALIPMLVFGFATAAVASPSARSHAHGGAAADGHTHGGGDAAAGHTHGTGGNDLGLGMLHNGHHEAIVQRAVDPMTQAKLDGQLAATREVVATYPTLADAMKVGYRRQGPYSPGLGVHYGKYGAAEGNSDGVMDRNDILHPMTIIYDGNEPTSKIAGFMYYSFAAQRPSGFIGPNDYWHYHTNTCVKMAADGSIEAPLGADRPVTPAECTALGGMFLEKTNWMVHVWTVPGYEVTQEHGGVFGEVNPALKCPDGSYYIRPISEWADHPLNVCKSAT